MIATTIINSMREKPLDDLKNFVILLSLLKDNCEAISFDWHGLARPFVQRHKFISLTVMQSRNIHAISGFGHFSRSRADSRMAILVPGEINFCILAITFCIIGDFPG